MGLAMCNFMLLICFECLSFCAAGSYDLITDKPILSYLDSTVMPFANITASRFGRRSKQYYTTVHIQLAVPLDDNYSMEILFYENVNNQFRRSFIELQYKWCSFLFKDPIFGAAVRRQIGSEHCPTPPAVYHLYNMTAATEHLPQLPFSKGRIYRSMKTKTKTIFNGYCDMELKKKAIKH